MLMKNSDIIGVDSDAKGIELVKSGKVDAMLSEYPVCMAAVGNNPDAGFVAAFSRLTYEPISIAMPGNDPLFMNWTQNFIDRLKATGTIEGLLQKWLGKPKL
jgi:ABC-type amino acid transport substrate-binding protein